MKKTIKNIATFVVAATIFSSCETVDFGTINDNPNGPTAPVTSQLLAGAQVSVSSIISNVNGINYVQHITEGQYPTPSKYVTEEFSYNGWYTGPIQNLNKIIEVNEDPEQAASAEAFGNNNNQIAVAKLLRSYFLQYMTDTWGYLPWSEAFQGINGTTPKFDSQEEIYTFMFAEVDEALSLINSGSGPVGDMLFDGNMDQWKTFGNTLKMVMALRISDVSPATAKTKFEQAVASNMLIGSNAENLVFTYGSDDNSDNPWEDRFESREDYILSETFINELTAMSDPRMMKMADPSTTDGIYVGAENGKVNGNTPDFSFITKTVIKDPVYQTPIYTYAQTELSLAEAAVKGWNIGSGTAADHFQAGIRGSMMQWGVDSADIDTYVASNTGATMANIAYEKWVALYLNGPEAWAEWRRLDAPTLTPSIYATDQRIPTRHGYSSSVEDNNSENYATMVSQQGPDNLYTKLWWDVD